MDKTIMLDEYTKNLLHEDTTISQFINPVDVQEICQKRQYFSHQQDFGSLRNEIEVNANRLISKERRNLAKTKTIDAHEEKLAKKQFSDKNNPNETKREAVVVVS